MNSSWINKPCLKRNINIVLKGQIDPSKTLFMMTLDGYQEKMFLIMENIVVRGSIVNSSAILSSNINQIVKKFVIIDDQQEFDFLCPHTS
jgi:hypothetical protein